MIVLQISWLIPEKGIDVALRAAKRVLEMGKRIQLVFCGDGSHRNKYEQLAAELGISEYVTWAGQVEDLARSGALRAAAIQIQCSRWFEVFCLAVAGE